MARSTYIYHVYDLACYDMVNDVQIPHIRPFTVKREAREYVVNRLQSSDSDLSQMNSRFKCIRYRDDIDEKPILIHL